MSWMFVAAEVLTYVLALGFLVQARWRHRLMIIFTAFLYALIVEYITVRTRSDYCYGEFMLMFPPMSWPVAPDWCPVGARVPVWGSVMWGVFIYSAMTISSTMKGPLVARCMFDALLVLTIDWIMDPLASWVKFWIWQTPGPWFGIPLDNYAGWFFLVFSFSLVNRTLREVVPRFVSGWMANALITVTTILLSILMLKGALTSYVWLVDHGTIEALLLLGILGVATVVAVRYAFGHPGDAEPQWRIFLTAILIHVFYVALIVTSNLSAREPKLLLVALATFVITVVGYSWPFRKRIFAFIRSSERKA